ncbi:hypothetical protein LEP1GSC008_2840 [Leptospira kirschneri serovar Bulgarica str. Nikolaevo]|uniref:Uncharacterized protein n=1 Tax=Leptospira kirschneri serovar Bulgarica str. Nikolaevo TaxID=1240687 RepID=M6F8M4_9LEPT|nr:hypothetical protein LEP1GSC008_2840 [Leptospira kirschneri serovar Bulgarica str. Nikolaevo]
MSLFTIEIYLKNLNVWKDFSLVMIGIPPYFLKIMWSMIHSEKNHRNS